MKQNKKNSGTPMSHVRAAFLVDEKAYCFWDDDIRMRNRDFINRIDAGYFEYQANIHYSVLNEIDENQADKRTRQHAAVALRSAYSHGLEVLFSLLFATLQAPDCVFGWFSRYSNSDLRNVVTKIQKYQLVRTKFGVPLHSWEGVVDIIFPGTEDDELKQLRPRIENFSRLWASFAHDFLDERFDKEYNSLKHGLRVYMGGFYLAMGSQQEFGTPAPADKMQTVAHSEFGTSFFIQEQIGKSKNYVIHEQSRNWNPENFFHGLLLISLSIRNILSFLKFICGESKELLYSIPDEEDFDRKPWAIHGGAYAMGMNSRINTETVPILSEGEIRAFYK